MCCRSGLLLVASTAVLALLGAAPSAEAACYSSTPATAAYEDNNNDARVAPEITTVVASLDSACNLTLNPNILRYGSTGTVQYFIDRDGDPRTGSTAAGAGTTSELWIEHADPLASLELRSWSSGAWSTIAGVPWGGRPQPWV